MLALGEVDNDPRRLIDHIYQFLLPLSLPSIPTPSSSYTNRPLWVRALLTSRLNKDLFFFLYLCL